MHIDMITNLQLNPLIAIAVFAATVVTDAVYVFFTAAVAARHRFRAATGVRSGICSPRSR
jgi:hypothetical protein